MSFKDNDFQSLLNVLAHFAVGALDDLEESKALSFEGKTDAEKEAILKVVFKTCEANAIILSRLVKPESFNWEKVAQIEKMLGQKNFDQANELLNLN